MLLKGIINIIVLVFFVLSGYAQHKLTLGKEIRSKGMSSNHSVIEGHEVGMKIKNKDAVKLKELNFYLSASYPRALKFSVNIYPLKGNEILPRISGNNHFEVSIPADKRISLDLSNLNIAVQDDFLVALEWLETEPGAEKDVYFSGKMLSGRTYARSNTGAKWESSGLTGLGFSLAVETVKP